MWTPAREVLGGVTLARQRTAAIRLQTACARTLRIPVNVDREFGVMDGRDRSFQSICLWITKLGSALSQCERILSR